MAFLPLFDHGRPTPWPLGKVVCVGRNYAEHARELNNEVPERPLLFMKPATAATAFDGQLTIPGRFTPPHYETEITLLIGQPLCCAGERAASQAIAGLGIGLDLTLRTLQQQLKRQGQPWERAKAFDGSCVLSSFARYTASLPLHGLFFRLWRNQRLVQQGYSGEMLFPIPELLSEISHAFTLEPGDVVMTGTPAGVGELEDGDTLRAELDSLVAADCRVVFA